MNSVQISDLLTKLMAALGATTAVVGYMSAEMWAAITGIVLAIGSFVWGHYVTSTPVVADKLAKEDDVASVVLYDQVKADAIPNDKVISLDQLAKGN